MNDYKCGLVSISFRKYTPQEIISAVKNCGLQCIEWGSDIHAPRNDIEKLNEIVKLQNKYGIYCSSYGTYFHLGQDDLSELNEYIAAAKILGTKIIRLFCGDKAAEEYSETEKKEFLKECKKAAKIAEEHDVIFCMECHNWSYTQTIEGALYLMEEISSPNFRMYWQLNQFVSEEENIRYSKLISKYSEHIHVFNWKGRERHSLLEGKEMWNSYLNNFEKNKTLLLEFMPDDKIESLKQESDALFEIVKMRNSDKECAL